LKAVYIVVVIDSTIVNSHVDLRRGDATQILIQSLSPHCGREVNTVRAERRAEEDHPLRTVLIFRVGGLTLIQGWTAVHSEHKPRQINSNTQLSYLLVK
jgi:hypothetical protein